MSIYVDHFKEIIESLDSGFFQVPSSQDEHEYFPEYLSRKLKAYEDYYLTNLVQVIDKKIPFSYDKKNVVIDKIQTLIGGLDNTIKLYYQGNILDSTTCFFEALKSISYGEIQIVNNLPSNLSFYRARYHEFEHLTKKDLFHIDFSMRHIVSTNRYSIPGIPALYLGDSSVVCWEEFQRRPIQNLWFSRFENILPLKIIEIQRIQDFLEDLEEIQEDFKLMLLLRYLVAFPLVLACTVRVKQEGNFKPEYIIPQMLIQYVSRDESIDGIKFLSTKVDYKKLKGVKAYNYVFPVKSVKERGFCDKLCKMFLSTQPTSIGLEDTLFNAEYSGIAILDSKDYKPNKTICLIEGEDRDYDKTSFGRIEKKLIKKKVERIQ